LIKEKLNG